MKKITLDLSPFGIIGGPLEIGKLTHLMGENGVGKTTLIYQLMANKEIFHPYRVGFLNQIPLRPLKNLLAIDYLQLLSRLHDKSLHLIEDDISFFDFKEKLQRPISDLSAGENQLLKILGLELIESDVWILDEPFQNLDGRNAAYIREKIITTAYVLVVDHQNSFSVGQCERYCLDVACGKRRLHKL